MDYSTNHLSNLISFIIKQHYYVEALDFIIAVIRAAISLSFLHSFFKKILRLVLFVDDSVVNRSAPLFFLGGRLVWEVHGLRSAVFICGIC